MTSAHGELARHLRPLPALNVARGERLQRKAEERVDGLPAGIKCGESGGGQHHAPGALRRRQLAQHGAFARAGPSGHEQRARITHIETVVQLGQLSAPAGFHGGMAPRRLHHGAWGGRFLGGQRRQIGAVPVKRRLAEIVVAHALEFGAHRVAHKLAELVALEAVELRESIARPLIVEHQQVPVAHEAHQVETGVGVQRVGGCRWGGRGGRHTGK